jgi:signal transduction histidine kinase
MSLLRKTLLYLVLVAVPVAIGGGWLFHALINRVVRYEIDEQLTSDLAFVQEQLSTADRPIPEGQHLLDNPHVEAASPGYRLDPVFSDTLEYDRREKQMVPVRRLTATMQAGGRTYLVVVKQAMGEFIEITQLLSVGIIVGFLGLLGVLLGLNSWVSRRLWQPFYQLIDQLRGYRLDARTPAAFPDSTITEFGQLGRTLNDMSQNLHQQYVVQKEFTDHAAHEMQTPLAIVTAQLDRLLATEPLTGEQVGYMEQAQGAIGRLVHLNKSLLLLSKIENNQFLDQKPVDLSTLTKKLHHNFSSYAEHRQLGWVGRIAPDVFRPMNPHLAEVLFSNLIKNAIIHALSNTYAEVTLTKTAFKTVNAGLPLPFPPDQLFDRFVKNPARPESTGLGLALVRQIAERHGMTVQHQYDELARLHTFTVHFPT